MCYVLFMIVLLAYDSCDSLDGYPSFPPLLVQEAPGKTEIISQV